MSLKFFRIVCASLTAALLFLGAGISYGIELTDDDKSELKRNLLLTNGNKDIALANSKIEGTVYALFEQCLPGLEKGFDTKCVNELLTSLKAECGKLPEPKRYQNVFTWNSLHCELSIDDAQKIANALYYSRVQHIENERKNNHLKELTKQYQANADKILEMVKGQYLTEYPKAQKYPPLGETLENFCSNPTWTITLRDVIQKNTTFAADYAIVFTGVVLVNGQKARFSWQIAAGVDDPNGSKLNVFHTRISINDNNLSTQEINNLLAKMYLN